VAGLMAIVEVIVSERPDLPERSDETILKPKRQPLFKFVVVL
jgi:hypothetical protein